EMRARLFRRQRADARVLGRDLEHADPRAVRRRRARDALLRRLTAAGIDARGRLARVPYLVEERSEVAADARDTRRRPVLDDHGAALRVVARHDAAKGCFA